MLSRLAHTHCSVARGPNTRSHSSPHRPRVFILDSGTTDPAPSTCILRAPRLNSTAAHFFPHTSPPDMQVGPQCQGSLVNTYCTSDLCSPLYSSHDILHTRGPPHLGPRGGGAQGRHPPTCQHNNEVRRTTRSWTISMLTKTSLLSSYKLPVLANFDATQTAWRTVDQTPHTLTTPRDKTDNKHL
jgi:hypothetical protein